MKSVRFNLNTNEVRSFLKGLAISIGGAALLYTSSALQGLHVPSEWAWALIGSQNILNFLRLWLQGVSSVQKTKQK